LWIGVEIIGATKKAPTGAARSRGSMDAFVRWPTALVVPLVFVLAEAASVRFASWVRWSAGPTLGAGLTSLFAQQGPCQESRWRLGMTFRNSATH